MSKTLMMLAVALTVVATPVLAEQTVPAGKLLPFLEKFLKVPPAERSRLKLSYSLRRDGQPLANLKATLVEKSGARTPLPVNGDGYFERLPTLAQIETGADIVLDVPADAKLGKFMSFGTQLKPAGEYDARELTATVNEANAVIGKAAGPMAFMAPKMSGIAFPKAEGGTVVFADGRSTPLPVMKETPYFSPSDNQGAVRVKLTKTPTKVAFYDGKK